MNLSFLIQAPLSLLKLAFFPSESEKGKSENDPPSLLPPFNSQSQALNLCSGKWLFVTHSTPWLQPSFGRLISGSFEHWTSVEANYVEMRGRRLILTMPKDENKMELKKTVMPFDNRSSLTMTSGEREYLSKRHLIDPPQDTKLALQVSNLLD